MQIFSILFRQEAFDKDILAFGGASVWAAAELALDCFLEALSHVGLRLVPTVPRATQPTPEPVPSNHNQARLAHQVYTFGKQSSKECGCLCMILL